MDHENTRARKSERCVGSYLLRTLCVLCAAAVSVAGEAGPGEFAAFPVDWSAGAGSAAGVSFLLDAPAGRDGFVRVADGHLVSGSGERLRIWGVNMTARACFPTKETAERLAARLAEYGVNCVRFHFLDNRAPSGLIDAARDDTSRLDAGQLDTFDFFVAELKKHGVYTNLNLNVGRTYKAGDGVREPELLGFAKALTYFNPRLLELQREYARALLTHRNPYTGHEYRREPAVAIVELVNENSLVESWFSGRLLGKATRKNPGTWTDIPASYERELTEQYNVWLKEKVPAERLAKIRAEAGVGDEAAVPRLRPDQFSKASSERFHTEATFYMEVERRYYEDMRRFLKEELKVEPLLVGTSDHNHGKSGYPLLASTARLDVIDGHVYWQHPHYIEDPKTGRRAGFTIPNTAMVNEPLRSTPVQLSRTALLGRPYTVSEVNHPFPHEYACEGIPILTAYAALHDWDGIFWYTFGHHEVVDQPPRALAHFDLSSDPGKMAQLAAGALMFLRADLRPAARTVTRSYSAEQVRESLRLSYKDSPYFTPGFPAGLALIHGMRIESLDGRSTGGFPDPPAEPFVSDTGEIRWSGAAAKQGVVTLQTPRSQAIVGFCRANRQSTRHLEIEVENDFCAVTIGSLDGEPIVGSARLLLTVAGRVANTGMEWNDQRTTLEKWGAAPARIEPVIGAVFLRDLEGAARVTAQALDTTGRPVGPAVVGKRERGRWRIAVGETPTTWYVVAVRR